MRSTLLKYCIPILFLIAGWFIHYYYYFHIQDRGGDITFVRENSTDYKFINPLLFIVNRNIEFKEYTPLKNSVQSYISKALKDGSTENISFYLNDLNVGEWVGVNENYLYAPASMLKVSVLMAYFKMADANPAILAEKSYYKPTDVSGQFYKPSKRLEAGYYTVEYLLNQMIIYSDNDAMYTLEKLHEGKILQIYQDLRLPDPNQASLDFMSPREYSRIYRSLYNGAYISHLYSEQALGLLSQTDFKSGIVFGVASSTTISHKFGELTNLENGKVVEQELHDCGIVYYPGRPYFICVMTRGDNFSNMAKVISDISKITFDYMQQKS